MIYMIDDARAAGWLRASARGPFVCVYYACVQTAARASLSGVEPAVALLVISIGRPRRATTSLLPGRPIERACVRARYS
jgi:hypothetical protein